MKKFKIFILVLYIISMLILLYEAIIPGKVSSAQHNFIKKIINNFSKIFIKEKIINATDIVVNNDLKDVYYTNETLSLDLDVLPSNASYKTLTFTSSDTNILEVDKSGRVKFNGAGKASITIKQVDSNIEKTIELNVLEYIPPIDELIEPNAISLKTYSGESSVAIGDVLLFYLEFDREDVNDYKFYLESSDETVLKTYDNYCYGVGLGSATITVTHRTTGLTDTMDITVTDGVIVEPTYFRIVGDSEIYFNDGITHTYSMEIDPNASNMFKEVRYIIYDIAGNPNPCFLDIGWMTGELYIYGYGEAYVYALSADSLYTYKMKVTIRNVLPNFDLSDKRVVLGEPYKIKINPINKDQITYSKYQFESSDESVAIVDGLGNITGKKVGTTTIKVVVDDGIDRVEKEFVLTIDNKVIEDNIGSNFGKIIRKGIAHFLGFIVFGFISFMMFYLFIKSNYEGSKYYSLLVIGINGLVFAILTEVIQLMSPGRDGTFRDVLLDYFGYTISFIISIIVLLIVYLIGYKRKNSKIINENSKID